MRLYRLGGEFRKLEVSHRLESVIGNRVDVGLIDQFSLDRLTRLVNGGLCHINDLYAIEMALKGLIFHDSIQAITPSAKLQIVDAAGGGQFVMNISAKSDNNASLEEILVASGCGGMLCGIDRLIGFADESMADNYISNHNKNSIARLEEENRRFSAMGIPLPSFRLDPNLAPIEYVAKDQEEFFDTLFTSDDTAMKRFLAPVAASGHATYVGQPNVRDKYAELRNYNAKEFFDTLDNGWQEHNSRLKRVLNIPIPLFVTIVLNRANCREDIPRQITVLRNEFAEARRQLWDLFDEADFRMFDSSVSARLLKKIEDEAAGIIPKWRDANDFWFPISFDFLGRAVELNALGLLKDIAGFLRNSEANQSIRVDASSLLTRQLQSVELRGLVDRHLSEQELKMIGESIDWGQH